MTISVAVTGGSISTAITGGNIAASVTGGSIGVVIAVAQQEYQGWPLNDNLAGTAVSGDIAGTLSGGNTADVYATDNAAGKPSFHLNGTNQYITIPLTEKMRADEIQNLWTKHENGTFSDRPILELCAKPGGGWYRFGVTDSGTKAIREESTDLINWSNRVTVMEGAPGSWDEIFSGVLAFQKDDGSWIMTYRGGLSSGSFATGIAYSADGTTFVRKDNGGVNDGIFPQFDLNYDPFAVLKVGDRWYMYLNGEPTHGHLSVYYSDDDFETFTRHDDEPIFMNGFCPYVFKRGDYYYILICRDIVDTGSALYDHGLALYRSPVPTFDYNNREFLGYPIINDESFDARYLDVPSMPFTDVYRDTYAPEFGETIHVLYTAGLSGGYARATFTFAELDALTAIEESETEKWHREARTFSFWAQFDDMYNYDSVFLLGASVTDSAPVHHMAVRGLGPWNPSLYLEGGNRIVSASLVNDTVYHFAIVDGTDGTTKVFVDGVLKSDFAYDGTNSDCINLYLGRGGNTYLDGYLWDFRIYNRALTDAEVLAVYNAG